MFAGMNANAQNTEPDYLDAAPAFCPTPTPLACADDDALHPIPGKNYTYTITASSSSYVRWFVTNDVNIMAAGALTTTIDPDGGTGTFILDAEDAVYNSITNTEVSIDVSWKAFNAATNNVFLVAYVMDAAGCTDNIEAYKIEPIQAFTLDIAGILDDGTTGATECVSPVVSAIYNDPNLTMDYGQNYVFFAVNAANWVHSWQATFSATGGDGSTLGTPMWAYPDQASGASSVWHAATDVVESSHYSGATSIGATGQCIIVRVPVDHNNVEHIASTTITLAVNGIMYDPATATYPAANADLTDTGAGNTCSQVDLDDTADYTLTPRPDLEPVDPTPFVPKN